MRFVVHQSVGGEPRRVGPFTAAYYLREEVDVLSVDRLRLDRLLRWFEAELTIPPAGTIPMRALFWFVDATPFWDRLWDLAHLLGTYDYTVELITTRSLGQIVYHDRHQVAAVPARRRRR
jgi:hypothetical protein